MSHFSQNLTSAQFRVSSKPSEVKYLKKYLPKIIEHLYKIKNEHPNISENEFNDILFKEIDNYASTVYENSYIFSAYMDYLSCQYLQNHRDVYNEISEKISKSNIDYDSKPHTDCNSFNEYLELYVYNFKSDLFDIVFDGYMQPSKENYKNFDILFEEHKKDLAKYFFSEHYDLPEAADVINSETMDKSKKISKLKEYSTWYKSPIDRKRFLIFTNLFMNGSFSYLPEDQVFLERLIRKDVSNSTEKIINQLDSLDHLKDYLNSYILLMCNLDFPEFASPFSDNGLPNKDFSEKISSLSTYKKFEEVSKFSNVDKLKKTLSASSLSSNTLSVETLMALNSFWSNRYVKELDVFSEAMFVVHDFGWIPKILNNEKIDISSNDFDENLKNMLIKMNFFYKPSSFFLNKMQKRIDHNSKLKDNKEISDGTNDSVEEKIIRYSYQPFIDSISEHFEGQYKNYFSRTCPYSENNITADSDWYIRLINPIISSYSMKNENINAMIASIGNSETSNYINAGIILDDYDFMSDKTYADIPYSVGIGIDAGLSFPIRIHAKRDVLIDFLKTINGSAIVPIYTGANDFKDGNGYSIPCHVVTPITEKHKNILKKASKNIKNYKNPKFISHLAFIDEKHTPEHMRISIKNEHGKDKKIFVKEYVDLESGKIFTIDDKYSVYSSSSPESYVSNLSDSLKTNLTYNDPKVGGDSGDER